MNKFNVHNINDFANLGLRYKLTDEQLQSLEKDLQKDNRQDYLFGLTNSLPKTAVTSVKIYSGQYLYFIPANKKSSK